MSVINKMLQDLDKRGAAQGRAEGSLRGAGIPLQPAGLDRRWKIAALALAVPLVLAIGWIVLRPGPETTQLAQVTPPPAETPKKAAETKQASIPQPQAPAPSPQPETPAPSPKPEAPVVAVAPPAPVAKPEAPAPTPQPRAPAVAAVPAAPVVKPPAPATTPSPQAPAVAVAPPAPVAKTPTPAPTPPAPVVAPAPPKPTPPPPVVAAAPPKAPVVIAQASIPPEKPAAKPEVPVREVKPDQKTEERPESAISISKKPPVAKPVAKKAAPEPRKPAPKPAVAVAEAKPSVPAPVADAGKTTAPAQEAAKGSISVDRRGLDSSRLERASAEYRSAVELMNQGRAEPAMDAFAAVLRIDPKHAPARQSLVALLISRGRAGEAQGVLRDGLAALPENAAWAMLLARLQVDGGDAVGALATLDGVLPYAKNRPDYHAFVGTVLQMQGRHKEAIAYYEIAVRLTPDSGRWLTGLAISLEEEKRTAEAREAYQRALATNTLAADLRAYVERKLAQLK